MAFVALKDGVASAPGSGLQVLIREGHKDLPVKMAGDLLVRVLSSGGPVFVKLGQDPLPFKTVKVVLEKNFKEGKRSWPFRSIEKRPIGAGSVGQVHFAELKDGTRVTVKVLRPGVTARVERDLEELKAICRLVMQYYPMNEASRKSLGFLFDSFVNDLSQSLEQECDFQFEQKNLKEFYTRFKKIPTSSCRKF